MKIMFSIVTHEDGTPLTTEELLDMEEEFHNKIIEKYKSEELPTAILQYLERRKTYIEKMRAELKRK